MENSRSMKRFLHKNVHWNLQRKEFPSGDVNNFLDDKQKYFKQNFNDVNVVNFSGIFVCDGYGSKNDNHTYITINSVLNNYYIIFVVLGIVSLVGNSIVIIHQIKTLLIQNKSSTKERKIYNILVLNLCLADLLMAFYLIAGPIYITKLESISFSLCNALGVISALSIQLSVSLLAIITAYRLCGIVFPFRILVRTKITVVLLCLVWFLWFAVVSLPLFNELLFAREFSYGIEVLNHQCQIPFRKVIKIVESLADAVNPKYETFWHILHKLRNHKNNEVALQVLKSFDLLNFERDQIQFLDFYNFRRGCTIETIISKNNAKSLLSFVLLMVNFAEYLFIVVSYFIIIKNISALRIKGFFPCLLQKPSVNNQKKKPKKQKTENKQIYKRIFAIVITDLVCGIPICIIGLVHYFGGLLSVSIEFRFTNFTNLAPILVMVLIPINSVVNPYIYSFHLWKSLYKRCNGHCLN